MQVIISGKKFSLIPGSPVPPARGDYVNFGGEFFPVSTKTGYPLSVVADFAAKQPNKIVLIPDSSGVYAFISRTGRVVHIPMNEANTEEQERNNFYRTLLRLTLLSDHKEVTVLGDIPMLGNTPCEHIELTDLRLPPIISRQRTWMMMGAFVIALVSTLLLGGALTSKIKDKSVEANRNLEMAQAEMGSLIEGLKEGRKRILVNHPLDKPIQSGTDAMPAGQSPFQDSLPSNKALTGNQIRVKNGSLQY